MSDENTFSPTRNFTISVADRVRAAYGPPAYAVRRRRIEDLEAKIVERIAALAEDFADPLALAAEIRLSDLPRQLATLNRLVDAHNAYYPCEANLPIDMKTGQMVERGEPWRPMPRFEMDVLVARARG